MALGLGLFCWGSLKWVLFGGGRIKRLGVKGLGDQLKEEKDKAYYKLNEH